MRIEDLLRWPELCDRLLIELDRIAREEYPGESGLPVSNVGGMARMREAIYRWIARDIPADMPGDPGDDAQDQG